MWYGQGRAGRAGRQAGRAGRGRAGPAGHMLGEALSACSCPLTALCVGAGLAGGAGAGAGLGGCAGIAGSAAIAIAIGAGGAQWADLEVANHDAVAPVRILAGGGHVGYPLLAIGQAGSNHYNSSGIHLSGIDGGLQQAGAAEKHNVGGGCCSWANRAQKEAACGSGESTRQRLERQSC